MLTLQDKSGESEGVVFSNIFAACGQHLQPDAIVLLTGRVDKKRGEPQIIVDRVIPIHEAPKHLAGRLEIEFREDTVDDPILHRLDMVKGYLNQHSGRPAEGGHPAEVHLRLHTEGRCVTLRCLRTRVIVDEYLLKRLRETVGESCVRVRSAGAPASSRNGNRHPRRNGAHREEPVGSAG